MKVKISKILNKLTHRYCTAWLKCCLLLICLMASSSPLFAQTAREYEIKSAILEKICRFITWPESTITNNNTSPFIIGVLGKNPFGTTLERIFSSNTIQNKTVQIKYYSNLEEIKQCNLLFISSSEKGRIDEIIDFFSNKPVLLVGDTKGYLESGIHFFLYINNANELRFKTNIEAIRRSQLSVSSFLLDYANKD